MRSAFSFYHSNKKGSSPWQKSIQNNIYTIRTNFEFAGNLLFAISNILEHRSNYREDPYKVFGIRYSQYVKLNSDFSFLHIIDSRNSLALHVGFGVGYPYGNSYVLPLKNASMEVVQMASGDGMSELLDPVVIPEQIQ